MAEVLRADQIAVGDLIVGPDSRVVRVELVAKEGDGTIALRSTDPDAERSHEFISVSASRAWRTRRRSLRRPGTRCAEGSRPDRRPPLTGSFPAGHLLDRCPGWSTERRGRRPCPLPQPNAPASARAPPRSVRFAGLSCAWTVPVLDGANEDEHRVGGMGDGHPAMKLTLCDLWTFVPAVAALHLFRGPARIGGYRAAGRTLPRRSSPSRRGEFGMCLACVAE